MQSLDEVATSSHTEGQMVEWPPAKKNRTWHMPWISLEYTGLSRELEAEHQHIYPRRYFVKFLPHARARGK